MILRYRWWLSLCAVVLSGISPVVQGAAVNLASAPLVTPAAAAAYYGTSTTHTAGAAAWSTRPPELQELARALGAGRYSATNYALTVYEYVRNNIAVDFRFGLSKGARGAVIDQSGTPFDQAHLMVELLRQGNVTASYQLGLISLTAAQFLAWTGIGDPSSGLVNAAMACQFLANGGIPATINGASSCTGLTGNLPTSGTTIVMMHVWVSANSQLYDPSYKIHIVKSGVDLASAMGCGPRTAPSCGTSVLSNVSAVGVGAVPSVQGGFQAKLENQLSTYARTLQTYIQNLNGSNYLTNNPNAQVEDLVGGKTIDLNQALPTSSPISALPIGAYTSSPQYSWTDVPDQFRTTFTVLMDNLNGGAGQSLFADETYGSRLRIWGTTINGTTTTATRKLSLYLEYRPLATSSLAGATNALVPLTVSAHHPYAANGGSYAAETQTFPIRIQSNVCDFDLPASGCSSTSWLTGVVSVVQGLGETTESTVNHYVALQQRDIANTTPENPSDPKHIWCLGSVPPTGPVSDPGCFEQHQGATGAHWLAQASRVMKLAGAINGVAVQHHHTIGAILSGNSVGLTSITLQAAISASSVDANSSDRSAAFSSIAGMLARLEGGVLEQLFDSPDMSSAVSMITEANGLGTTLLQVNSANYASAAATLSNYSSATLSALQAALNVGYTLIVPQNGSTGPFCLSSGTSCITYGASGVAGYGASGTQIAYIVADFDKGVGGAGAADPVNSVIVSTKILDYSRKSGKRYGVDLASGGLDLTATPDLVTGVGEFPYSLSLIRSYSPDNIAWVVPTGTTGYGDVNAAKHLLMISGSGWTHNFNIYAEFGSDGLAGMGRNSALDASAVLAALYVQRTLNPSPTDFRANLASIFTSHWACKSLFDNVVTVKRPPRTSVFLRLADNSFDPGPGSNEALTQTGARVAKAYGSATQVGFDSSGVTFLLTDGVGTTLSFAFGGQAQSFENIFTPRLWSFRDGTAVNFSYSTFGGLIPLLSGVSNNLGRSLSFPQNGTTLVTEGTGGRSVAMSATYPAFNAIHWSDSHFPIAVSFTAPDSGVTRYNYIQNPLTLTGINRQYSHISQWFTPSGGNAFLTVGYDSLYRVSSTTDNATSPQTTTYFVAGLYGSENQKRGELMEPIDTFSSNPLTTRYFDRFNQEIQSIDALGRVTSRVYDTGRRLIKRVYPELNTDTYTYDVRHNVLTEAHNAKPATGFPGLVTTTSYPEIPTLLGCANTATCNRPATVDGPRTDVVDVTTYSYNNNGTLARVVGPAVSGGNAQTDFCYLPLSGISLLTGKIVKVSSGTNRVWSYAYNPLASNLTLQSMTADPGTTLVPPATVGALCTAPAKPGALALTTSFGYDVIGNVTSIDGPRTDVVDVSNYNYDLVRRLTKVSAPQSTATRYCYDLDGQLVSTNRARVAGATDPNSVTAGQCAAAYAPAQWQTESRSYRPTGDLASVIDAGGNQTQYDYDADGRLRVLTDPDGRQTATAYDVAGQSVCTWRGGSGWTAQTAPVLSTCTGWTPASYTGSGPIRYSLTAFSQNGKASSIKDADNNLTSYTYDGLDRLKTTSFADATHEDVWYTVDGTPTGTLCSSSSQLCRKITRKSDVVALTYDAADELVTKAPANLPTVSYGYNLAGERASVSNPVLGSYPAHSTGYDYDGAGRAKYETNDSRTVSYQWDQAGNRAQTTWPDGYYVSYVYDELNRMTYARENGTVELAFYQWDPLSRRQSVRLGGSTTNTMGYAYEVDSDLQSLSHGLGAASLGLSYTHNASHQLATFSSTDPFYLPDPVGASATAYATNALNQYTSVGGNGASYDLDGNLLSWAAPGGRHTYTYDSENRFRTAAVAGSLSPTISYDYDALGRRVGKTVNGVSSSYLLDGGEEIAEYSGATLLRRYVTGPAVDDRIAHAEGSATSSPPKTYYHVNHQGTVIAMTDGSGNVQQRTGYDEFGASPTPPTTGEPFAYTGRRYDPETGLYYYRARYYSPQLGRFLQTDPVGYGDDLNLYAYVGNDPLDKTDPTGKIAGVDDAVELAALCAASAPCAAAAVATLAYVGKVVVDAGQAIHDHIVNNESKPSDKPSGAPPLPDKPVGEGPKQGSGNRTNSGPLTPENGGAGDSKKDFDKLTGGKSGPAPEGSNYPPGTQVGENGIAHRPAVGNKGSRIDIPTNGDKSHETLHYPPPPPRDPTL